MKFDVYGKPSGVLIDQNIATLMLPMIIVGAMIGVQLQPIIPEPLIVLQIVLVLGFITITTTMKYCAIRKAESSL